MKIQCIDRDIRQVLSSGVFVIPRFQRPFSWDKENVEELWRDATSEIKKDYFIGSFVTYEMGDVRYGVVDGQQRLTSITIALCVIRDKYKELGYEALALGIHKLIETTGLDNKDQYIIKTESSYPYLQLKIQSYEKDNEKLKLGDEEHALAAAHSVLKAKIENGIQNIYSTITDPKQHAKEVKKWLGQIRDKFLGLKVVSINLATQDDAYTIFETMNTRGKDLTPADLIKNHVLRLMPAKGGGIDRTKDHWLEMQAALETASRKIPISTFLHHFWISKFPFVIERQLFKAYREHVDKQNIKDFFEELRSDSILYRAIDNPDIIKSWNANTVDIKDSIYCISNVLNIQIANPLLLTALRQYVRGILKDGKAKELFSLVENYHYIYTTICGLPSSGGVTQMYAVHARELAAATTAAECSKAIQEFKIKIKSKIPTEATFVSKFQELSYSEHRRKEVLKYTLWKLYKANNGAVGINRDDCTFEHISPQSVGVKNVHSIGNLILIPAKFNGSILGNKDFLDKKLLLTTNGYSLGSTLSAAIKWDDTEISTRTDELARDAYRNVWAVK
ncbi:DUF262 domain-containing HNH endonuclease family protein [Comamonas sp. 17RB]|uniref:DUF262 domain-containing protein n=1 Tax=Comamonas sp. 17RB TaxID=3047025 RepID=UPI0024B6393C|nr:DUF262 domain-containing HNH endonuclease family protein [Comamonas sp. 17RB]MDI9857162.1 DUF262 domain-containing HNH endonuclease family protein [Comamonas sp. 17RB]